MGHSVGIYYLEGHLVRAKCEKYKGGYSGDRRFEKGGQCGCTSLSHILKDILYFPFRYDLSPVFKMPNSEKFNYFVFSIYHPHAPSPQLHCKWQTQK